MEQERIKWYKTPLPKEELSALTIRSDAKGLAQSLGYLGVLAVTGGLAVWSAGRWSWPVVAALIYLHGMTRAFCENAMHELNHGTVFRNKTLNGLFIRLFSFLNWINYPVFQASHMRHHRFTLHPPADREELPNTVPSAFMLLRSIFDPVGFFLILRRTVRHATGRMDSSWEAELFPEAKSRANVVRWARVLLLGHGAVLAISLRYGWWLVPLVVSMTPMYGHSLRFLCNKSQHAGLPGHVPDWRVVARSVKLDPLTGFLYWHMQYHVEHHMYAAVPCYNLKRLNHAIAHDLPERHGLLDTWRRIFAARDRNCHGGSPQEPEKPGETDGLNDQ